MRWNGWKLFSPYRNDWRFRFSRNKFDYIYIYIYDTKLISLHKYFNQVLLTKLFADTNIAHIFCKIGQTSNTNTNDDYQFGTEGAILTILDRL
jgi:hypothetical protein